MMNAINRLKSPQAAIGLFVAGLLLFAVVGIAKELGSAAPATVAGSIQSNVAHAVALPVAPQATVAPVQQVVQVVVVVTATPTSPPYRWLDATVDVAGGWWVWADSAWVACSRIASDLTYNVESREPSWSTWYWLNQGQRQQVYARCQEVTQ